MFLSGKRGPALKLSGERLAELVCRYESGQLLTALAKEYNVSASTVYAAFGAAGIHVKDSCERGSHTSETLSRAAQAVALAKAGKLHRCGDRVRGQEVPAEGGRANDGGSTLDDDEARGTHQGGRPGRPAGGGRAGGRLDAERPARARTLDGGE